MKGSVGMLTYATVLGVVCALLLTGAARFTEPYRKNNAEAERVRNILGVLGVPFDPDGSSKEAVEIFERNVRVEERSELTTYVYAPPEGGGAVQAVAMAFAGRGLWGPIKGLLSLEPDMVTIHGITFYEQQETPGLGGEIAAACLGSAKVHVENCPAWFRHQFEGKTIEDVAGRPGIRIVSYGASGTNEVDAITGATMTSDKIEAMLNAVIKRILEQRDRNGR